MSHGLRNRCATPPSSTFVSTTTGAPPLRIWITCFMPNLIWAPPADSRRAGRTPAAGHRALQRLVPPELIVEHAIGASGNSFCTRSRIQLSVLKAVILDQCRISLLAWSSALIGGAAGLRPGSWASLPIRWSSSAGAADGRRDAGRWAGRRIRLGAESAPPTFLSDAARRTDGEGGGPTLATAWRWRECGAAGLGRVHRRVAGRGAVSGERLEGVPGVGLEMKRHGRARWARWPSSSIRECRTGCRRRRRWFHPRAWRC